MKTETEPKQTAMQRLIERLREREFANSGTEYGLAYSYAIKDAESLLPEERNEIEEAWENGLYNCGEFNAPTCLTGEQYYQTKFKQ